MTASIVPGYDFGVNEVPNKANFLQQALGLSMTGVDEELLAAGFKSILGGDSSGSTGATLPAEGWTWVDPSGNWWLQNANGPVKLWRADGGWSTNRFLFQAGAGGLAPEKIGLGCSVASGIGATETAYKLIVNPVKHDTTGRYPLLTEETGASGALQYVGRGMLGIGFQSASGYAPMSFMQRRIYGFRVSGNGNQNVIQDQFYDITEFPSLAAGTDFRAHMGLVLAPDVNSSQVSQADLNHRFTNSVAGYFYGAHLWGPGTVT